MLLLLLIIVSCIHIHCVVSIVMETLYSIPYALLEVPNLKLKKPGFVRTPSAMFVFACILLSYFLVTGGIIYDVIVEPPSVGTTTDDQGHQKPVAFMQYRVNGQYIMEGLASSFLFALGGFSFIILERSNAQGTTKLNRILLMCFGFAGVLVAYFTCRVFMTMKLP